MVFPCNQRVVHDPSAMESWEVNSVFQFSAWSRNTKRWFPTEKEHVSAYAVNLNLLLGQIIQTKDLNLPPETAREHRNKFSIAFNQVIPVEWLQRPCGLLRISHEGSFLRPYILQVICIDPRYKSYRQGKWGDYDQEGKTWVDCIPCPLLIGRIKPIYISFMKLIVNSNRDRLGGRHWEIWERSTLQWGIIAQRELIIIFALCLSSPKHASTILNHIRYTYWVSVLYICLGYEVVDNLNNRRFEDIRSRQITTTTTMSMTLGRTCAGCTGRAMGHVCELRFI